MKNVAKGYIQKMECLVQKAVYYILPELHFQRVFLGICFVNSNLAENPSKNLTNEEELGNLPKHSTGIFKQNNTD